MDSPIGALLLVGDGTALTGVYCTPHTGGAQVQAHWRRDNGALREARGQLEAYFAGDLTRFTLPLAATGTAWQQRVWDALVEIPYGQTASYGEIAARLGHPGAARAVGLANGRNTISVVVPCHRVIGAGGALTGYGGGLPRKRWLLDHESGRGTLV